MSSMSDRTSGCSAATIAERPGSGPTMASEENDLPRVPVTGLALHPSTHRLYASTLGRGCYYTRLRASSRCVLLTCSFSTSRHTRWASSNCD
jgi:hypothetical protein